MLLLTAADLETVETLSPAAEAEDQLLTTHQPSPAAEAGVLQLLTAAEEKEEESGNLSRCFVLSTGITLTPAQLTIHG